MDRIIEKKTGWRALFTKKALPWWLCAMFVAFMIFMLLRPGHSMLRVDGDSISISEVKSGEFNDYIRLNGTVQPLVTVQISPIEGGVVDAIFIEEGSQVRKGEEILHLSNDNLDLQILNSEAELAEKENILRNTQIQMEQDRLNVKQSKADYQLNVKRLRRTYEQQKALYDENLIAREDYLKAKEDYDLAMDKLQIILDKEVQDSLFRSTQVERMRESLENMQVNMGMIRKRKDNLTIKAPIDGQLGILDAVLGENIGAGTKIGQISDMSSYKIEAQIDEHYIDRVVPGLSATFERQGMTFSASLRKVYPEVRDGKFKADFKFMGDLPENIRNGQTYYLNLQLGSPEKAVLVSKGNFYQHNGGKWIYVLSKDGSRAEKREIRLGRQNPQDYEVLEGLQPGEKVVVSGYENFGDNDVLVLK
ncbi:MAG: HlyD family efflux transporter periplasmic adaptor subunit [Bacteroidales bacterium]|nr:HlyD family efflux transporter periplasmic adaptor subunit [Bacteroidales bacterium]